MFTRVVRITIRMKGTLSFRYSRDLVLSRRCRSKGIRAIAVKRSVSRAVISAI